MQWNTTKFTYSLSCADQEPHSGVPFFFAQKKPAGMRQAIRIQISPKAEQPSSRQVRTTTEMAMVTEATMLTRVPS